MIRVLMRRYWGACVQLLIAAAEGANFILTGYWEALFVGAFALVCAAVLYVLYGLARRTPAITRPIWLDLVGNDTAAAQAHDPGWPVLIEHLEPGQQRELAKSGSYRVRSARKRTFCICPALGSVRFEAGRSVRRHPYLGSPPRDLCVNAGLGRVTFADNALALTLALGSPDTEQRLLDLAGWL